jgi:hypothetical protein
MIELGQFFVNSANNNLSSPYLLGIFVVRASRPHAAFHAEAARRNREAGWVGGNSEFRIPNSELCPTPASPPN